jgi:large subunit ribosomal protein L6
MLSFLLPTNIDVSCSKDYILIKYNEKAFIKKNSPEISFHVIETREGARLFVSSPCATKASSALSNIYNLIFGLSCGYQQRRRLVGIGFRAILNSITNNDDNTKQIEELKTKTKNYIKNRFDSKSGEVIEYITIKLGYSHEVTYPITDINSFTVSSVDGRSKGRLIDLQSTNYRLIKKAAAEIRSFRYPDSYKGKGIFYNNEVLKLKKGKRKG